MIEFDNLTYLHGKPQGTGLLKANPEDFVVVEDLGFEPDGEGEHILVRILKNGCNTRFVADALAKFLKIHAREVSFAGQKDKHAVTEQWLCARVPGKEMPDLSAFQLEGCQVLEYARHKRKLRLGALKGNAFTLVLREVSNRDDVEQRLIDICVKGVPNYFGAQRFGIGGSNLQGALRWAQTNTPVRDRNKRSFWLSAARSALFNQIVAERLKKADVNQVVDGDALQLARRGSWFVATTEELAEYKAVQDNPLNTVWDDFSANEIKEKLILFLERLSDTDRNLFIDAVIRGYRHKELAEKYHLSGTNISVKIFRLRDRFRKFLERED